MQAASRHLNRKGFSLIEIAVAIGVLGISVVSIAQFSHAFLRAARLVSNRTQAAFLAQEGMEAVRYLRDSSWSDNIDAMTTGTPHYLHFNSSTLDYALTATEPPLIEGRFERTITAHDAFRDANDDIVSAGGTADTSTKKFTVALSWRERGVTTTESIVWYLADLFGN
jgi:prepilin-type N-terminal cleavage/methylation domain-containing protein